MNCLLPFCSPDDRPAATIVTLADRQPSNLDEASVTELDRLYRQPGEHHHLLLNFGHVHRLNGADLGRLVLLHQRVQAAGGRLSLVNLHPFLLRILAITRLDTLLDIRRPVPSPTSRRR